MPALRNYALFISHAWSYSSEYDRLVEMLKTAPYFQCSNCSVPRCDPLEARSARVLEQKLHNQIRPAHCVLILSGMYVSYSDWIQREIDIANRMNKPIIGIRPWGSERVPAAVQQSAIDIVGWNTVSIINAIRRYSI